MLLLYLYKFTIDTEVKYNSMALSCLATTNNTTNNKLHVDVALFNWYNLFALHGRLPWPLTPKSYIPTWAFLDLVCDIRLSGVCRGVNS